MADNILNMTDIAGALKDFYLPALRIQLNENVTPFYNKITKSKDSVVGEQIVMALRHGRNGGIGNRADNGALPTPNSRKTTQAKWKTKNMFGVMQLTDKTIKASKDSRGAFASILETEMEDLLTDAKNSINRQLFGDGSGELTKASGANTGAVVPVDSVQYLEEGMLIDLIDAADGTTVNDSGLEITSIDESGLTVTLSATPSPATADGDILVISGSLNLELTGLKKIFTNDNTLYDIDRSSNKWFNANVTAVSGALTFTAMQKAIDDAEKKGSMTDYIMTTYGVNRAYLNLLHANKRFNNTMKLDGGHKEYLSFNGIPVIPDRYALSGQMDFLASENFKLYTMGDWEFMQKDGSILKHKSGYAAYEAVLVNYCDLGCDKPSGQTRLTGVTES